MLTALFPIGDDNSDRNSVPLVTWALIAANFAVFLLLQLPSPHDAFTYGYSVVPAKLLRGHDITTPLYFPGVGTIPEAAGPHPIYLTILWSMFMHAGWAHILGNMLYLWIFGDNVEDAMGPVKYLCFYLICGTVACLSQVGAALVTGGFYLYLPSLGASGAIAGVLGAYLVLYPTRRVRVLLGWWGIVQVPAFVVIGLWIMLQLLSGFGSLDPAAASAGGVAYFAHIGGALCGMILVWFFRDPSRARRRTASWRPPGRYPY